MFSLVPAARRFIASQITHHVFQLWWAGKHAVHVVVQRSQEFPLIWCLLWTWAEPLDCAAAAAATPLDDRRSSRQVSAARAIWMFDGFHDQATSIQISLPSRYFSIRLQIRRLTGNTVFRQIIELVYCNLRSAERTSFALGKLGIRSDTSRWITTMHCVSMTMKKKKKKILKGQSEQ